MPVKTIHDPYGDRGDAFRWWQSKLGDTTTNKPSDRCRPEPMLMCAGRAGVDLMPGEGERLNTEDSVFDEPNIRFGSKPMPGQAVIEGHERDTLTVDAILDFLRGLANGYHRVKSKIAFERFCALAVALNGCTAHDAEKRGLALAGAVAVFAYAASKDKAFWEDVRGEGRRERGEYRHGLLDLLKARDLPKTLPEIVRRFHEEPTPFHLAELVKVLPAMTRLPKRKEWGVRIGDVEAREVFLHGERQTLMKKQFLVVSCLHDANGKAVDMPAFSKVGEDYPGKVIDALFKSDSRWRDVIVKAGRAGQGYRLLRRKPNPANPPG